MLYVYCNVHLPQRTSVFDSVVSSVNDKYKSMFMLSVLAVPLEPDERQCLDLDEELRRLVIGEQFYFVPFDMGQNVSNDEVTWYRDDALTEPISTDQNQRVHYQGGALFFMDLRPEDSGKYTAM